MAITTSFTSLVGCTHPIQNAGMGTASPELAVAVAGAGGLGMLSGALVPAEPLRLLLEPLHAAPPGKLGINFLIPFLDDAEVVDVAAQYLDVVEFFYGDPDPALVRRVHGAGALAAWQVGSLDEALAAMDAGCDFIIAQGIEAGGHVRGATGLLPLLAQVLPRVTVPVLAAGGIGDGRGIASVIAMGAAGARLGTRFVVTPESGYHPRYQQWLIEARSADTVYTDKFKVMWDAPHRVLRSCIEAVDAIHDDIVGTMPIGPDRVDVPRCSIMSPLAGATGALEAMCLYAGQSVDFIHDVRPAADLVRELAAEAESCLRQLGTRLSGPASIL